MYNGNYNPLKAAFPFKSIKNKRDTITTTNTISNKPNVDNKIDIYANFKRKNSNPLKFPLNLNFNLKKKSLNNKRNESKESLNNKSIFKNRKVRILSLSKKKSLNVFNNIYKKSERVETVLKYKSKPKNKNFKKINLKKKKKKKNKDERKNFLNFYDKNTEFYKKKNNYSNHLISKAQRNSENTIKPIKKSIKEVLKLKLFQMTSIFSQYKFFSCNCELIRIKNGKCISISNFLNLLKAPSNSKMLLTYQKMLQTSKISPDKLSQIHKDIKRTFSKEGYFNSKSEKGFKKLERLLVSISRYKKIGYVQGMNFIAASFLWHCEDEEIAYFIIIKIFEIIEAEKCYTSNLSGIIDHCKHFWSFLKRDDNTLVCNLEDKGILPEMILPEWFITLGSNIVPLQYHVFVFKGIIYNGWDYFYDLLKRVLKQLFPIYANCEFSETLLILKLNKKDKNINWFEIFN